MSKDKGAWIQTYSGRQFYLLAPKPEDIDIIDIAHALSMMCRFVGHSQKFYSVAQHSILVAQHCKSEFKLHGLLHDASEAYISDLARPIKKLDFSKDYKIVEAKIMEAVHKRFNIVNSEESEQDVKLNDSRALFTEKRDLMKSGLMWPGENSFKSYTDIIDPLLPEKAEYEFYKAFSSIISRY